MVMDMMDKVNQIQIIQQKLQQVIIQPQLNQKQKVIAVVVVIVIVIIMNIKIMKVQMIINFLHQHKLNYQSKIKDYEM